jgi:hypothetical protein
VKAKLNTIALAESREGLYRLFSARPGLQHCLGAFP